VKGETGGGKRGSAGLRTPWWLYPNFFQKKGIVIKADSEVVKQQKASISLRSVQAAGGVSLTNFFRSIGF